MHCAKSAYARGSRSSRADLGTQVQPSRGGLERRGPPRKLALSCPSRRRPTQSAQPTRRAAPGRSSGRSDAGRETRSARPPARGSPRRASPAGLPSGRRASRSRPARHRLRPDLQEGQARAEAARLGKSGVGQRPCFRRRSKRWDAAPARRASLRRRARAHGRRWACRLRCCRRSRGRCEGPPTRPARPQKHGVADSTDRPPRGTVRTAILERQPIDRGPRLDGEDRKSAARPSRIALDRERHVSPRPVIAPPSARLAPLSVPPRSRQSAPKSSMTSTNATDAGRAEDRQSPLPPVMKRRRWRTRQSKLPLYLRVPFVRRRKPSLHFKFDESRSRGPRPHMPSPSPL